MKRRADRIVLIGFRGAGKSSLGKHLARLLDWPRCSTDAMLLARLGLPIEHYVRERGWPAFREHEAAVARELASAREVIIDCGGGLPEQETAMAALLEDSLVVWLDADVDELIKRQALDSPRPLLSEANVADDVRVNHARRAPLYARYAHIRLDTGAQNVADCARQVQNMVYGT